MVTILHEAFSTMERTWKSEMLCFVTEAKGRTFGRQALRGNRTSPYASVQQLLCLMIHWHTAEPGSGSARVSLRLQGACSASHYP